MKKFTVMLVAIGTMFGKKLDPSVIDAYKIALAEFSEADLLRVGVDLMKGKFFPRPFDFITAIEGPLMDPSEMANLRWSQILNWAWHDSDFPDDPTAHESLHGIADKFMIVHGTNAEIRGFGFAFRGCYQAMANEKEREEKQEQITGSEVRSLIENIGKEPPKEIT